MLPQKNRITTEEFMDVLKQGQRIFSQHFSLSFVKKSLESKPFFKASVVISKKVSKKSPERNYQKRLVREAIRKAFPLTEEVPFWCIFFIQKNVSKLQYVDIENEIRELSKKLK